MAYEDEIKFAREHAGESASDISRSAIRALRRLVPKAIEEGWTVQKLSTALRTELQLTPDRALGLAQRELCIATSNGALITAKRSEVVTGKVWRASEDSCETCKANEAAGSLPLDAKFPSGQIAPPACEWCRCDLEFQLEEGTSMETISKKTATTNPRLVACKECGHPIARGALACPGCGASPSIQKGLGVIFGLAAIFAGLIGYVIAIGIGGDLFGDVGAGAVVYGAPALLVLLAAAHIARGIQARKSAASTPAIGAKVDAPSPVASPRINESVGEKWRALPRWRKIVFAALPILLVIAFALSLLPDDSQTTAARAAYCKEVADWTAAEESRGVALDTKKQDEAAAVALTGQLHITYAAAYKLLMAQYGAKFSCPSADGR